MRIRGRLIFIVNIVKLLGNIKISIIILFYKFGVGFIFDIYLEINEYFVFYGMFVDIMDFVLI